MATAAQLISLCPVSHAQAAAKEGVEGKKEEREREEGKKEGRMEGRRGLDGVGEHGVPGAEGRPAR